MKETPFCHLGQLTMPTETYPTQIPGHVSLHCMTEQWAQGIHGHVDAAAKIQAEEKPEADRLVFTIDAGALVETVAAIRQPATENTLYRDCHETNTQDEK